MTSAGSCWFHCLILIQPSTDFTPHYYVFLCLRKPPALDSFVQVQSILTHPRAENTNSTNIPYHLPALPQWRRGWLVWRSPRGSGPLVPVGGCCPLCWACPCPVSIPPGQLPGLGRRRWRGGRTAGRGWTSASPGSCASQCPQPQMGLFPWPDSQSDGAATSGLAAQILNQALLQVKRNFFSTRQQLVFHRSCAFFWTQIFYFTLIFFFSPAQDGLYWKYGNILKEPTRCKF